MSPSSPTSIETQIAQLQAAMAAQETLRPALGDAIVGAAIAAIQARLDTLLREARAAAPSTAATGPGVEDLTAERLFALAQEWMPADLADRMLAVGGGEGERRQLTILSADLSCLMTGGSDGVPRGMPGALEVMRGIAMAVYRYEGIIQRVSPVSLLAVFGAPVLHEDDAERALHAGLEIRQALEELCFSCREPGDDPPGARIAVNTGPVMIGRTGGDPRRGLALMGETVNTAVRLEGLAQPGQILVCRETFQAAQDTFEFIALNPMTVKGRREPLAVFELQHARRLPVKKRGVKELFPAFVGREPELAALEAASADMRAGQGRVILIRGEAGLGKSRLLAEWRKRIIDQDGVQWAEGHAFAHTSSQAYAPFIDLFRRLGGFFEDEAEPLARLRVLVEQVWPGKPMAVAVFANLLDIPCDPSDGAPPAQLSAEAVRAHLLTLFEDAIRRFSQNGRLWMAIEDLHWIDTTSLELIELLIPLTRRLPFTILATSRPGDQSEEILDRFQAEARAGCIECLTLLDLSRLSEAASLNMLEQLLSTTSLPAGLRSLVLPHADGNPFFIEEILRALIQRGALVLSEETGRRWRTTPQIESYQVPETLRALLMARFDRLPPETRRLAQQAAVIGRIFSVRLLYDLAGGSTEVTRGLDALERAEVIQKNSHSPEVEYTFDHPLTQEVIYTSLLAPRRRELHSQVGLAMESASTARTAANFSIIGEHFLRGEVWDKAFAYLLQAGDSAARLFAVTEARLHYAGAWEALSHLPETGALTRQRVALLVKLDSVSYLNLESSRRESLLAEAENTMRRLIETAPPDVEADRRLLYQVYFALMRHHMLNSNQTAAFEYARRGLELAKAINDPELNALLIAAQGILLVLQGQFRRSEVFLAGSSTTLAEKSSWEYWISGLIHLSLTLAVEGKFSEAAAVADQVRRRAAELKNLTGVTQADCSYVLIAAARHEFQQVLLFAEQALRSAEESRDIVLTSMVYHFTAWAQSNLGEHAMAADCQAKAEQIHAQVGTQAFPAWNAALDAEIALNAGQVDASLRFAERAADLAVRLENPFGVGLAQRAWAKALLQLGLAGIEEIEQHLERSLAALEACGAVVEAAYTQWAWALVCKEKGDPVSAGRRAELAAGVFQQLGMSAQAEQARRLVTESSA